MNKIAQHIDEVTTLLNDLDLVKKCQFSAWCCHEILKDTRIKQALFEITQTQVNYQMLQAIIQACWYDYQLINAQPTLELLEELQFDYEHYPHLFVAIEGLNELLIAIECIIHGIQYHDNRYFANIAENVLNWKDIQVQYSDSDDSQLEMEHYQQEYLIQIQFLKDLKNEQITAMDIEKYR